jgi:hypothetical protein
MTAISSLITLAGIVGLLVLIYGPWQDVCTAYGRQVLFEKRDAIFDLAAKGELSFHDPNYRTIRALLEKSIRFAHELTIPRLIFYFVLLRKRRRNRDDKPELIKAVDKIEDAKTREAVRSLVIEALNALLLMTIAKSPLAMIIMVPCYVVVVLAHIGRSFARSVRDHSQTLIQIEAERVGSSLDSAAA